MTIKGKARKKEVNQTVQSTKKQATVIFVEGATEEVFYKYLLAYIKRSINDRILVDKLFIYNTKGISRFNQKLINQFKNNYIGKYPDHEFKVILAYDSDVFDLSQKPPVDWKSLGKDLKRAGAISVKEIVARKCTEDWFLLDIDGLCKFLKISKPKSSLCGKTAVDKLDFLFRKAKKLYQKGEYCHQFLDELNFSLLYSKLSKEMEPLIDGMYKN